MVLSQDDCKAILEILNLAKFSGYEAMKKWIVIFEKLEDGANDAGIDMSTSVKEKEEISKMLKEEV